MNGAKTSKTNFVTKNSNMCHHHGGPLGKKEHAGINTNHRRGGDPLQFFSTVVLPGLHDDQ